MSHTNRQRSVGEDDGGYIRTDSVTHRHRPGDLSAAWRAVDGRQAGASLVWHEQFDASISIKITGSSHIQVARAEGVRAIAGQLGRNLEPLPGQLKELNDAPDMRRHHIRHLKVAFWPKRRNGQLVPPPVPAPNGWPGGYLLSGFIVNGNAGTVIDIAEGDDNLSPPITCQVCPDRGNTFHYAWSGKLDFASHAHRWCCLNQGDTARL
jgi:hypothetical protein